MGKFKRIPMSDIKAMQKTLDDLPDKNMDKTREEAADLLDASLRKALEKGYSIAEISAIMGEGNVSIPPQVLRKKLLATNSGVKKEAQKKAGATHEQKMATTEPKSEAITSETKPDAARPETAQKQKQQNMPSYFTPDREEL